jgi:hypothetical protein
MCYTVVGRYGSGDGEDRMMEYIDVRGPWPVYVCGVYAVELQGQSRDITVDAARKLLGR